jgi:hypothetical protein
MFVYLYIQHLLYIKFTLQMNPISVTVVEESFHEMRDKSYLTKISFSGT